MKRLSETKISNINKGMDHKETIYVESQAEGQKEFHQQGCEPRKSKDRSDKGFTKHFS